MQAPGPQEVLGVSEIQRHVGSWPTALELGPQPTAFNPAALLWVWKLAFSQAPPGTAVQETSGPGSGDSDIKPSFPAVTARGQSRGNPRL